MSEEKRTDFANVTHYTKVDVQPGGINIQNVEHLYQADVLKALGIELEIKNGGMENAPAKPDKDIEELVSGLMELHDKNGKRMFTDNAQWYAVFRILSEFCNQPEKMSDFVRIASKYGWDKIDPPCKYDSMRRVNTDCPRLATRVINWESFKDINDKYRKQWLIADFLLKKIGII